MRTVLEQDAVLVAGARTVSKGMNPVPALIELASQMDKVCIRSRKKSAFFLTSLSLEEIIFEGWST